MRFGRMPALARQRDIKLIRRRHHRPFTNGKMADRNAGHVVHAIDFLNAPAGDQAILHHLFPTPAALFRRLEDNDDRAIEIPRLAQVFRRPQQHGRMPVMAAGVHLARHGAGIRHPCLLEYRQRIHIRAQTNHPSLGIRAPLDDAHHARAANARSHLIHTEFAQ